MTAVTGDSRKRAKMPTPSTKMKFEAAIGIVPKNTQKQFEKQTNETQIKIHPLKSPKILLKKSI